MKLTAILILAACMQVNARAFSQKINISLNDVPLQKVFREIKKQTGYNFLYTTEMLEKSGNVSVYVKNSSLEKTLQACFEKTNLVYSMVDNTIIIKEKEEPEIVTNTDLPIVQDFQVKGKVVDENNAPVEGVSVLLKGTSKGTYTDANGEYTIEIPENSSRVLVFSFVGMTTKEVNVDGTSTANVTLERSVSEQQEIVVVAYGTQKKVNLTGAVVSIGAKQLENRAVADVSGILNGQAPGLTVIQNGGNPGQNSGSFNIRGQGTFNNTDPLIILDGIPVVGITNINPQDIENVSILKDAASSSIYGVRAANGVILITTKRGKAGKMKIDFSHQSGITSFIALPNKVDAVQLANLYNQMNVNDGVVKKFSDQDIQKFASGTDPNYPNHDMVDAVTRNGVWNAHSLSISGGTEKTAYNISLGYTREGGIIEHTDLKKYTMRTNLDFRPNDKLYMGVNLATTFNSVNTPVAGVTNVISLSYYSWANDLFQFSDGRWAAPFWSGQNFNALAYNSTEMGYNKINDFNGVITGFAEYKLFKGLKLRGAITALKDYNKGAYIIRGVDLYSYNPASGTIGIPAFTNQMYQKQSILVNNVNRNFLDNLEMTYQLTANYNKSIGNHNINVLGGIEKRQNRVEWANLSRRNLLSDALDAVGSGDPTTALNGGASTQFGLISTFGRINYNYDERYLLEGNIRYDGSSRFAQELRYDVFPSVSLGWRIAKEKFFNVPAVSDLKLRGSYGTLGSQEVGDYQYLQSYALNGSYFFNDAQQAAITESVLANTKLKWEKTSMLNIGLDGALLKNRLTISADYFIKNTKDILLSIPQPAILGAPGPVLNSGAVRNKGFEVTAGYNGQINKLNYYVRANFAKIKNEIVDLAGTDRPGFRVGDPISNIFGYKAVGLFQSDAEIASSPDQSSIGTPHPGDIKYADVSGPDGKPDGKINDLDRVNLGKSFPGINYGISLGANYKGFDFSMVWQGIGDAQFMAQGKAIQPFLFGASPLQYQMDVWTPANTGAKYPRITSNGAYYQASSYWVRSAAYLKLRNAQIGYTLPENITSRINVSRVRFYVSGENLVILKGFSFGYDPEQFYGQGDPVSFFGTNRVYPTTRRFLAGVNISL